MCTECEVVDVIYEGTSKQVVVQNRNGPCTLVAIINYLSLRLESGIKFETDWENLISEDDLVELFKDQLKVAVPIMLSGAKDIDPEFSSDALEYLSQAVPKLTKPIDLNPFFSSVDAFDDDRSVELEIMKCFYITVLHGWVPAMGSETATSLHSWSYKHLNGDLDGSDTENKVEDDKDRKLVMEFMEKSNDRLTMHGISRMRDYMITEKKSLAILYRNESFYVMHLHNGMLHILQTDHNTRKTSPDAVWQILNDVDENHVLVTSNFHPIDEKDVQKVKQLYDEGMKRPDQIANELLMKQTAEADRHAAELIALVEKEKLDQEIKTKVKAKRKKKKSS